MVEIDRKDNTTEITGWEDVTERTSFENVTELTAWENVTKRTAWENVTKHTSFENVTERTAWENVTKRTAWENVTERTSLENVLQEKGPKDKSIMLTTLLPSSSKLTGSYKICYLCQMVLSETAFTRCRHILKTVKNVTDRPPVHTKTAHILQAHFEKGRFWKRISNQHIMKTAFAGFVWMLAQILLPSHFSPFSKCSGIVWTQSDSERNIWQFQCDQFQTKISSKWFRYLT